MIEIRKGASKKFSASESLIEILGSESLHQGTLYIGYPILFSPIDSKTLDALWVSEDYGIVIFNLIESGTKNEAELINEEDDLIIKLETLLKQHPELRLRQKLLTPIHVVHFGPDFTSDSEDVISSSSENLLIKINQLPRWDKPGLYPKTLSVIQSVTRLKEGRKRDYVSKDNSKGFQIKQIESTLASLDNKQEKAVIEYYEGVQRIRGLAGSGKTIILALKAAYLHSQNPDWKIAVTFNTRALKDQFKSLIERFVIEKKGELPDWNKIEIVHAWGSSKTRGIYYDLCKDTGVDYLNFRQALHYQYDNNIQDEPPFETLCRIALEKIDPSSYVEKYDLILVDEAQDLSEHFLKICYNILKKPKRLVYAYDELQKLYEGSPLKNPSEIFDINEFDDHILDTCYRNSRPVLSTAHALGFGIYRNQAENKIVQFFDDPKLWKDVGYKVEKGKLEPNHNVTLSRTENSSPKYLETYLNDDLDDMIVFKSFKSKDDQAKYLAKSIEQNITHDELLHRDIIVIHPQALTTKSEVGLTRALLRKNNISSHISGEANADIFFEEGSIAFTGINRAKGNEVPMVYILNADYCYDAPELRKKRNILFTAITRSKAWVRVLGVGEDMDELCKEYARVKEKDFKLEFKYPTKDEIQKMNLINRDISETEKESIKNAESAIDDIEEIISLIENGSSSIENYPPKLQKLLSKLLDK